MNETFSDKEAAIIQTLASDIARLTMRSYGKLPPTILLTTKAGVVEYRSPALQSSVEKDTLVTTVRLLATANAATSVTTILESWATVALRPGSAVANRLEAVMIVTEWREGFKTQLLQIERHPQGKFKRLRLISLPGVDAIQGRFAGLVPPTAPTEAHAREARLLLGLIGLSPDGKMIRAHLN